MKRRDFLINSMLAFSGAILLTGCDTNEVKAMDKNIKHHHSNGNIHCSSCSNCIKICPKRINIPVIFALYNEYKATGNQKMFKNKYENLPESEKAHNCLKCGACNNNCPHHLDIPQLLAKVDEEYKKVSNI